MMMMTWLNFTYQESYLFHPLPHRVTLMDPIGITVQIKVRKYTDQAEEAQQHFTEKKMMLKSLKCY